MLEFGKEAMYDKGKVLKSARHAQRGDACAASVSRAYFVQGTVVMAVTYLCANRATKAVGKAADGPAGELT